MSSTILLFVLFVPLFMGFILWRLLKRSMTNTYTKAKWIFIIYVSILLLSMAVDELYLKNKREKVVEGNIKESYEVIDNIYLGNIKDIKGKYIHNEWEFPYSNQELNITALNSPEIVVEYVANSDSIHATFFYHRIIDDYEMNLTEPLIDLHVTGEELFISNKQVKKMYRRVFNTSVFNHFSSLTENASIMWGKNNSMAILYLQVPENVVIKTNDDDIWINELGE